MIALLCILPLSPIARDSCDLVELNRMYDEEGRHVFDQLIWMDWNAAESRHDVVAWRLVKSPAQIPARCWRTGGYVARWQDGDTLREVRADSFRETVTQFDPEVEARAVLATCERRGLR